MSLRSCKEWCFCFFFCVFFSFPVTAKPQLLSITNQSMRFLLLLPFASSVANRRVFCLLLFQTLRMLCTLGSTFFIAELGQVDALGSSTEFGSSDFSSQHRRTHEAGNAQGFPSYFFCEVLLKWVYVHFLL